MVMRFGMSEKLGPRVLGRNHDLPFLGREMGAEPDYSDEVAREIDDEIRRIIEDGHELALQVLRTHMDDLHRISQILIQRETIDKDQFERLLAGETENAVFPEEETAAQPAPTPEPEPRRQPKPRPFALPRVTRAEVDLRLAAAPQTYLLLYALDARGPASVDPAGPPPSFGTPDHPSTVDVGRYLDRVRRTWIPVRLSSATP